MLILPLSNQVYSSNITTELGIRPVVFTFSIIQVGVSAFNGKIHCHICNSIQIVALIIILALRKDKTLVPYNNYFALCS